ncbi:Sorting nexin-13 [Varanus komodoensis]|nr:Sorting nexin-13 [Varanus komodoensis]
MLANDDLYCLLFENYSIYFSLLYSKNLFNCLQSFTSYFLVHLFSDINTIKNQINSLLFVKKVCDSRIMRLQSGKEIDTVKLAANFGKLCTVPLDNILVNNVALQFFMDYMQQMGGQAHLFFWMTVEGYRVTAQKQLEVLLSLQKDGMHQTTQTKGLLRTAAVGIYDQYLSEKASPRVNIGDTLVAKLAEKLNNEDPTPEIFDEIQRKVYELMLRDERFYPSFKQHALYVRMLAELDMLKDPSFRGSDDGEGVQAKQNAFNRCQPPISFRRRKFHQCKIVYSIIIHVSLISFSALEYELTIGLELKTKINFGCINYVLHNASIM